MSARATVLPRAPRKPTKPAKPTLSATVNSYKQCLAISWPMLARWWSASRAIPAYRPRTGWEGHGTAQSEVATNLPASANNYFSLAVFRPDEAGQFRRLKARFQALHAVMLDDIGTKVAMERLTLPTLLVAGNLTRQLSSWVSTARAADRWSGRRPAHGRDRRRRTVRPRIDWSQDAAGPAASWSERQALAAVPCRMVEWSPELRYSVGELVDGLELDMTEARRPERQGTRRAQERPLDGDPVWIPRPDENAVLVALRHRGLYKAPLGDGKHDITCPWVNGAHQRS